MACPRSQGLLKWYVDINPAVSSLATDRPTCRKKYTSRCVATLRLAQRDLEYLLTALLQLHEDIREMGITFHLGPSPTENMY